MSETSGYQFFHHFYYLGVPKSPVMDYDILMGIDIEMTTISVGKWYEAITYFRIRYSLCRAGNRVDLPDEASCLVLN